MRRYDPVHQKLDIHKPILYGFSDGGVIGLMIAIKEPDLLSKLISIGADLYPTGMKLTLFPAMIKEAIHRDKVYRMMFKEPHIKARESPKDKDSDGDPCRRARCHQDFPHQKDRPVHSREHT